MRPADLRSLIVDRPGLARVQLNMGVAVRTCGRVGQQHASLDLAGPLQLGRLLWRRRPARQGGSDRRGEYAVSRTWEESA